MTRPFLKLFFLVLVTVCFYFWQKPVWAQNQTLFDIIWACPDQTEGQLDFSGKKIPIAGSSLVVVAQPNQSLNLAEYDFTWLVNGREQINQSGPGKNFFELEMASIISTVKIEIAKDDQLIQKEIVDLPRGNQEILVYRGLNNQKTAFYFSKALVNNVALPAAQEHTFLAFIFPQLSSDLYKFHWQVGEQKTAGNQNDNELILSIPNLDQAADQKVSQKLQVSAYRENEAVAQKEINLIFP